MMSKLLIKEYIKLLIEQVAPEAPKNAVFGQYLFAPDRRDVPKPPEKDTKFELEFYNALSKHYGGDSTELALMAPKILKVKSNGLYKKLLTPPPNKKIYRILSFEKGTILPSFLPKSLKSNSVILLKPGITINSKTGIQSWTYNTKLNELLIGDTLIDTNKILCVFQKTKPSDNFFINPFQSSKSFNDPEFLGYEAEQETISFGPVVADIGVYYYNTGKIISIEKILAKILDKLEGNIQSK